MNRPRLVIVLALLLPAYGTVPAHAEPMPPGHGAGLTCGMDAANGNAIGSDRYTGTVSAGPFAGTSLNGAFPHVTFTCTVLFGGYGSHSSAACASVPLTADGTVVAPLTTMPLMLFAFEQDEVVSACHEVYLCTKVQLRDGWGSTETWYFDAWAHQFTWNPFASCVYATAFERTGYHVTPEPGTIVTWF